MQVYPRWLLDYWSRRSIKSIQQNYRIGSAEVVHIRGRDTENSTEVSKGQSMIPDPHTWVGFHEDHAVCTGDTAQTVMWWLDRYRGVIAPTAETIDEWAEGDDWWFMAYVYPTWITGSLRPMRLGMKVAPLPHATEAEMGEQANGHV